MARAFQTHFLALRGGAPHIQLNTGGGNTLQTQVLDETCSALLLSARTGNAYVTWDNTSASASNGLEIVAGANPVYIPLGYNAHSSHTLKMIGSAASTLLNIVQLS